MATRIQEEFEVRASYDRAWSFLTDPQAVSPCLPGAELTEVVDEGTYRGRVSVQVGPVSARFQGQVQLEELNREEGLARMVARGTETGGGGGASATMTARLKDLGDGRLGIRVEGEVNLSGRLAQFGRGLVRDVSAQLFGQFAECVRARLEGQAEAEARAAGQAGAAERGAEGAHPQARPLALEEHSAAGPGGESATQPQPVRALPLLWGALRGRLRSLFRRPTAPPEGG